MFRLYIGLASALLFLSQVLYADASNDSYDFFEHLDGESLLGQNIMDEGSANGAESNYQQGYAGEDQLETAVSVLSHDFYKNDRFRFYNQTRYDISDLKNKYLQDGLAHISLSDISFSLGYGMEYLLTPTSSIGYEYLSSFPSNNSQSIRFFAKRIF